MASIENRLDQKLDIAGSQNQESDLILSEEVLQLGSRISGQLGFNASIVSSGGIITISGLAGMTNQSVGHFLTLFGANSSNNNGVFLISLFNSNSSVDIINPLGSTDLNNSNISWIERNSYSLEDDINFIRTDRSDIKGVNYSNPVPTYFRCDDTATPIPANLANIAGKTTDAKSLVNTRKYEGAVPVNGQNYIHISGTLGEFPYANSVNRLGLPVHDHFDSINDDACYCDIIDQITGSALNTDDGYKIFGFSRQGSTGVNGSSFEVELRFIQDGQLFSESLPYNWEISKPNIVDVYFPFRECFADMDESALRIMVVHGVTSGGINVKPTEIGQFLYALESDNLVFTPQTPLVNDQGFILTNADGIVVVK